MGRLFFFGARSNSTESAPPRPAAERPRRRRRLARLAQAEAEIAAALGVARDRNIRRFAMIGCRLGSVVAWRPGAGRIGLAQVVDIDHRGVLLAPWDIVLQRPDGRPMVRLDYETAWASLVERGDHIDRRDLAEKLSLSEVPVGDEIIEALSRKVVFDPMGLAEAEALEFYALTLCRLARSRGEAPGRACDRLLHLSRAKRIVVQDAQSRWHPGSGRPASWEDLAPWAERVAALAEAGLPGGELLREAARIVWAGLGRAPAYPSRSVVATRKLADGSAAAGAA